MAKKKTRRRAPGRPPQFRQERIVFVTPPGNRELYRRAAELEGVSDLAWMRAALRKAVLEAFETHDIEVDEDELPPVQFQRPPRLQPLVEDPTD